MNVHGDVTIFKKLKQTRNVNYYKTGFFLDSMSLLSGSYGLIRARNLTRCNLNHSFKANWKAISNSNADNPSFCCQLTINQGRKLSTWRRANAGEMQFSYATNSNAMQPMYKTNVSNITHMHFSLLSSAYSQVKWSPAKKSSAFFFNVE